MKNNESPDTPASDAKQDCNDLAAVWNLPPTTMIGTRPTVTLVYSPARDRQREAEYVASLGFWQRMLYTVLSHSKRG